MYVNKKEKKMENEILTLIKHEKRKDYLILYICIIIFFLITLLLCIIKGYFSWSVFLQSILINLLGLIPAILFFDFFYRKISLDSSSIELSNKITSVLMSNPDTLKLFNIKQCQKFIDSTVYAIVKDEQLKEMIMSNLRSYLVNDLNYSIKTFFECSFEFYENLPENYNFFSNKEDYYYVQERIFFKIRYLRVTDSIFVNKICIVFAFNNVFLDKVFRNNLDEYSIENCIFRESLDLNIVDINFFKSLSITEFRELFKKMFKLNVQVDNSIAEIDDIKLDDNGIIVNMNVNCCREQDEHSIQIYFYMPKLWKSVLEVAFVEPTKAPNIFVSYSEDKMLVNMFSFLSKSEQTSFDMAYKHDNGIFHIVLHDEWIMPVGGVIFTVEKINI